MRCRTTKTIWFSKSQPIEHFGWQQSGNVNLCPTGIYTHTHLWFFACMFSLSGMVWSRLTISFTFMYMFKMVVHSRLGAHCRLEHNQQECSPFIHSFVWGCITSHFSCINWVTLHRHASRVQHWCYLCSRARHHHHHHHHQKVYRTILKRDRDWWQNYFDVLDWVANRPVSSYVSIRNCECFSILEVRGRKKTALDYFWKIFAHFYYNSVLSDEWIRLT